ncbi:MAG: ATP-binding protein [Pseudonocardiaceae bacterium]
MARPGWLAGTGWWIPSAVPACACGHPCPCASPDKRDCTCAPSARRRYLGRLSGPLLDRGWICEWRCAR